MDEVARLSGATRYETGYKVADALKGIPTPVEEEITPDVKIEFNGKLLTEDVDFTVSYSNNINVGTNKNTAKVTITNPNYQTLSLTWNAIDGADTYQIYRSTKENGTYNFSDLEAGTYQIKVEEEIYESVGNAAVTDGGILNIVVKEVTPYELEAHKYITKLDLVVNGKEEKYTKL